MSEKEESVDGFFEALGCLGVIGCFVILIFGYVTFAQHTLQEALKEFSKEVETQEGYIIGKITKVESWNDGKFVYKEGNIIVRSSIEDRCRFEFADGRTKELVGMPKGEVPLDKEMVVIWGGHNFFMELLTVEEFKKRSK